MNKTQLVDALAERLGDRRTAATAVDGLLETIVDTVKGGGSVSITGFGVFEGRARAARTARNPRTGEAVAVPAATVPAFGPGAGFRTAVGGGGAPAPRPAPSRAAASAAEAPAAKPIKKTRSKQSFAAEEQAAAKPAKKGAKAAPVKAAPVKAAPVKAGAKKDEPKAAKKAKAEPRAKKGKK
jgi:DNA-binding protein HU-beta